MIKLSTILRKRINNSKEIQKNEDVIKKIMLESGMSKKEVLRAVKDIRTRIPQISYYGYLRCKMYKVPVSDQVQVYEDYILQKEKRDQSFVESVSKKSGWSFEEAKTNMQNAKQKYGISFREYNRWNLQSVLEDQYMKIKALKRGLLKERKDEIEQEKREDRRAAIANVMAATGLERQDAIAQMREARKRTGCSFHEYGLYKMWDIDKETQNQMFFMSLSKVLTKKYNTDKVFIDILFDKEASNIFFDKYMKRAWCVNTKITEEEFVEKFIDSKKIFYKPLEGHHGNGTEPFEVNKDNIHDVYRTLSTYSEGVVEEYVVQHHLLSELAPGAVNTLRVVTFSSNDQPVTKDGKHIEIAYVSLKMAGVSSIVDNLVNGGMVAGVDMNTGKIITKAVDIKGNTYEKHPATGTKIVGFQIPFYEKVEQLVKDVYNDKKIEGYLGWDIAITEEGPIIIEVNSTPGVILLQYPYVPEHKGMKPIMEKYL